VDREYRERAEAGVLKTITPRRFNPEGLAWLPIMHTERQGWDFTAMYSNTARAHELDRTRDWVVIYYQRDGEEEQCTIVTEYQGALRGERVVRGRERECEALYLTQRTCQGEAANDANVAS
jgi:putative hydrolase